MILDSESEIKEKRGGRDIRSFVVFVLVASCLDDNFRNRTCQLDDKLMSNHGGKQERAGRPQFTH